MKISTKKSILEKTSRLLLLISKYYNIDNPQVVQLQQCADSNGTKLSYYIFNEHVYKIFLESTLENQSYYPYADVHPHQVNIDLKSISNFNITLVKNETWIEIADFIELNEMYKKYKRLKIIN